MYTKDEEKAKRLKITLSEPQKKWLINFCKKHHTTPSKYIRWLLIKKAEEMIKVLRIHSYDMTISELEEMEQEEEYHKYRDIINPPWEIDDDD